MRTPATPLPASAAAPDAAPRAGTLSFYAPADIVGAVTRLFGNKHGEKSAWFQAIARKDLEARGELRKPSEADERDKALRRFNELLAARPAGEVLAALEALSENIAEAAGAAAK